MTKLYIVFLSLPAWWIQSQMLIENKKSFTVYFCPFVVWLKIRIVLKLNEKLPPKCTYSTVTLYFITPNIFLKNHCLICTSVFFCNMDYYSTLSLNRKQEEEIKMTQIDFAAMLHDSCLKVLQWTGIVLALKMNIVH